MKINGTSEKTIARIKCTRLFFTFFAVLLILAAFSYSVGSEPMTVEVGIPVEEHPELFLPRSMPTHGEGKIAVFLIDFPDYRNENPYATVDFYDKLYFSGGVNINWIPWHHSVADFFYDQSYGKLTISGKVFDWYTAEHERSYYNDKKGELVMEAAAYYLAQGVDFSQFDGDGDGIIDSLIYHFAGDYSEDDYNDPWYYGAHNSGNYGKIDGLQLTSRIQLCEKAQNPDSPLYDIPIDTICHELMHSLGMPDLYSEYEGAAPVFDLMSQKIITINPYLKMMLGWIDTVLVVTEDTNDIRLDVYSGESPGDIVIVTDEYTGMFDEFTVIAYRDIMNSAQGTAWHIDASLNNEGTAFKYSNLFYDSRPDVQGPHEPTETGCPYLFIEELDSDPIQNYIGYNNFNGLTKFDNASVIGPDSMPSTDTHDGKYTGIRIFNFDEHNGEYLTFDVSFVTDTAAPVIITEEESLRFAETVKIHFNELIYKGDNFDSVIVTDPDGNPLDASVILPHYPRNEIEITFRDESYLDGYKIVFPAGCLRDSSGNEVEAATLYASREDYIYPIDTVKIPDSGEYLRNNSSAHFFSQGDSLVVITRCFEKGPDDSWIFDALVEFMRLDLNGNVLTQKFIRNPFANSSIEYIMETADGSYIFICREDPYVQAYELLFCIDAGGDLKWTNESYRGSGISFFSDGIKFNNGIILQTYNELFFVDSATGTIDVYTPDFIIDIISQNDTVRFFDLSDEKLLVLTRNYENQTITWEILNMKTNKVTARQTFNCAPGLEYEIFEIYSNSDGTYSIRYRMGDNILVALLDSRLNIMTSMTLGNLESNMIPPIWIDNDGFFYEYYDEKTSHEHSDLYIIRYDKHLNPIWKSEASVNLIHFFKSHTGEIMAYRSMLEPERECYIDNYGSEEFLMPEPHTHSFDEGVTVQTPTFTSTGVLTYTCTDCSFSYNAIIPVYKNPDIDGDGSITEADAKTILKHIVDFDATESEAIDINNDGQVNIRDAAYILLYLSGKIS